MSTSDKLFFWMFQNHPDSLLRLLHDLPADATGYRFSAPVLKGREYRLDGLFNWRVVVICAQRGLNFGRPEAVAEFIRERVWWIELLPAPARRRPLSSALAAGPGRRKRRRWPM